MSKASAGVLGLVVFLAMAPRSSSQPAALDSRFAPALNSGAQVYAIAVQTNGQIIIGGAFTSLGSTPVTNIARLNQDGTLDSTFNPGPAADIGYVTSIAVQKDGKVVIGGSFASSTGIAPSNLARLNTNGTPDGGFDLGLWMDDAVNAVVVQPDGKILFGGAFQIVDGYARRSAARLESNGFLDIGFDACVASSSGSGTTALALLSDGRILMSGGNFAFSTGAYRVGVARLNPNGDLDASYAPPQGINFGSIAYALACRTNGTALLGGNFSAYNGTSRGGIVQLTTNGYPDTDLEPGAGINFGGTIYAIAFSGEDKIIIGGNFTDFNGQTRYRLARLNIDGSLDSTFDAGSGPNDSVGTLVVQNDRKILVAGKFSSLHGTPRNGLARLNGDHLASHLDPPRRMGNGQFQVVFYGENQAQYALLASSNLVDWISITNFTASSGAMPIVDPTASPPPKRFYRAVSVP
jgi:uncharacterized delta-60 repeat protein